ncbi:hypothetical protein Tco_0950211 [Tanacetum coccineum]
MRRASKVYTRVDIPLFPTMLVQGLILQGEGSTISIESHHTPSGATPTSQPPVLSPSRIPTKQETELDVFMAGYHFVSSIDAVLGSGNIPKSPTMPHDSPLPGGHTPGSDEGSMTLHELTVLCTKLSNKVDSLETELKQTKQTYGAALTKLIKKVKKLEQTVKTSQARRRAKIVVSDDEESSEDTSKQGRMIEDIDQDAGISLVTPTKVSSQEDQSEDQLGVLSAAKVLADAAKKNVNTYTRRRRAVSTTGASMPISIAEEQAKFNAEQEELLTSNTTEDEANPPVADINWEDVEAQIQADEDLAQKLLEEERENLSIEERARLLVELINKRKKLQAAKRYKEIRNKPQTMSQQRKTHACHFYEDMEDTDGTL